MIIRDLTRFLPSFNMGAMKNLVIASGIGKGVRDNASGHGSVRAGRVSSLKGNGRIFACFVADFDQSEAQAIDTVSENRTIGSVSD